MAYCEISDVRRRCSSVSEDDVGDSVVSIYILEAQDEIDTQLSSEYTVPFVDIPTKISRMCADLAAYYLMGDYPDKVFHDDKTDIYKRYDIAMRELRSGRTDVSGSSRKTTSETGVRVAFTTTTCSRWGSDRTVDFSDL